MNKTILSFVLGFGIIYILNKNNKDLILHGFLTSIVIFLVFKKLLPSFEGLENKEETTTTTTTSKKSETTPEGTTPPTGPPTMPESTAKMPTKDSDADSSSSSPAPFPQGPGINTKSFPTDIKTPTLLDDKKCTLTECQSLWDQRFDQLIPHPELKGKMLAPKISIEDREKRYQTQQDVRGLSRLLNTLKQHDAKGSDRMITNGLEDATIMGLDGKGISSGKSKDGSIKILNINVMPGADDNDNISRYFNNIKEENEPVAEDYAMDTSVDLSKSLGVPQGEAMTTNLKKKLNSSKNLSQSNSEQINKGWLDYNIPLTDQKNKPRSPYTYVNPKDWLSTGKKGSWTPYNDGDFSKFDMSNSTEQTIAGSMSSTKSLPLASSIGTYFEI